MRYAPHSLETVEGATQDRVKRSYLGRGGWQGKTKSKPLIEDVGENVGEDEEEDNSDPGGKEVEPPGQ